MQELDLLNQSVDVNVGSALQAEQFFQLLNMRNQFEVMIPKKNSYVICIWNISGTKWK